MKKLVKETKILSNRYRGIGRPRFSDYNYEIDETSGTFMYMVVSVVIVMCLGIYLF